MASTLRPSNGTPFAAPAPSLPRVVRRTRSITYLPIVVREASADRAEGETMLEHALRSLCAEG